MTDCFVGLVSHIGSRFAESQGSDGLTARLCTEFDARGLSALSLVNVDDAYRPELLVVDGTAVRRAVTAQILLEARWSRYLCAGDPRVSGARRRLRSIALTAVTGARIAAGWLRYYRPWHGAEHDQTAGARMVRRLLNIELSHASLLRAGLASGAQWVLILEDDAHSADPVQLAANLQALMASRADQREPTYVNISQSFSNAELGVEYLLKPVDGFAWTGEPARQVLEASRPISNTVCAILYRADFLTRFLERFDALLIDPVVPIDWKLNIVLMDMYGAGEIVAGDCWVVTPGPVDQRSMQPE
jgi:hypothetical protein